MPDPTEYETRKKLIDIALKRSGWVVGDRKKVVEEVDTKQSDFKAGKYKTRTETLRNPEESAYADYVLLDSLGLPIAVIEAKKTSISYLAGQKQAEDYFNDIKKQTGRPVLIFLTNGRDLWFWNKEFAAPRAVSGYHDRASLERVRFQNEEGARPLAQLPIDEKIINRDYQIESVKRVLEGMDKGHRKFLIVQATGTGKTRVAMALSEVLLRAKRAGKILFIADRKELRDQAFGENGFKAFFPQEAKSKIISGKLEKNCRLYATTIQTLMECYQEFSPGDFDVIFSDEAHRSIYVKWREVFTYFDAIEIGLTATPSDLIERDTFRFFDRKDNTPTFLYTYEQAVDDGWLAKYKRNEARTHFQIAGVQWKDLPSEVMTKVLEGGFAEEDIDFRGTDIEKKVIVVGTNEAIVEEFMDYCIKDATGTLPAKTIFFAVSQQHATRLWEAFNRLYPEYKGELARRIVSEDHGSDLLLKQFKTESMPRVAISVGMLDTGVDIPEVCNLVFAKPVLSKIRFLQMIGRGTRHDRICKNREWLPADGKKFFLIFDFWRNFEFHKMHPEGREAHPTEAVTTRIFLVRLKQLELLLETKDPRADLVKAVLRHDIESLPLESATVKEHSRDIEIALSPNFWQTVGLDPVKTLKSKIAPMMRYQQDVNLNEASWTLKLERLSLAILNGDREEVDRQKEEVGKWLLSLPPTIRQVKEKLVQRDAALRPQFWEKVSFEDAQKLRNEFGPLMKYRETEPRPIVTLDMSDIIQQRQFVEYGPMQQQAYAAAYAEKVEKRIKQLAVQHPTILKIKRNEVLTEEDLQKLEETLNGPDLYITEETLQKAFQQPKGTLVQFVKQILGMYEFPDP